MALKRLLILTLPLCLLIVSACTSSRSPCTVSGKVTYKGQPVTGGNIAFHRTLEEQKGSLGFQIKPDGTYEGAGLQPAEYAVTIETESLNKDKPKQTYGGGKGKNMQEEYRKKQAEMGKGAAIAPEAAGTYVKIPAKYNDPAKSGLKVTLTSGKNTKDFDLSD